VAKHSRRPEDTVNAQVQAPNAPGLVGNVLWNFAGSLAPLLGAVIAAPLLISGLGLERFGILMIAWMVIGYFNLFDMGLARALTKLVAERLESGRDNENPGLIWTALAMLFALGVIGGSCLWLLSPWLAGDVLNIPSNLTPEAAASLYYLAASVPLVVLTAGLRALLDAHHRFDIANIIRIPSGLWLTLSPLAVLPFSNRLDHLVLILIAGRVAFLLVHLVVYARIRPGFLASFTLQPELTRLLLSFGGWIAVSNIVGPIMLYFDRFVIGALMTMTAVAYYTTPYEVVVKLAIVPDAICSVLFPAFAVALATNRARAGKLCDQGEKAIFLLIFPLALIFSTLAYDGLSLWIDESFAQESYRVAQWLCAGALTSAVANIPSAVIQASGRPDLTAKLHLVELPFYVAMLFLLIKAFGVQGAAAAWTIRASIDVIALLLIARRWIPALKNVTTRGFKHLAFGLTVLAASAVLPDLPARLSFLAVALPAFACFVWRFTLKPEERDFTLTRLKPLLAKQT
jgi:O-antigen/teichoic acid export membrane protein